ncbi:hypothetical protein ACJX0J_040939, partial [Zea mays]
INHFTQQLVMHYTDQDLDSEKLAAGMGVHATFNTLLFSHCDNNEILLTKKYFVFNKFFNSKKTDTSTRTNALENRVILSCCSLYLFFAPHHCEKIEKNIEDMLRNSPKDFVVALVASTTTLVLFDFIQHKAQGQHYTFIMTIIMECDQKFGNQSLKTSEVESDPFSDHPQLVDTGFKMLQIAVEHSDSAIFLGYHVLIVISYAIVYEYKLMLWLSIKRNKKYIENLYMMANIGNMKLKAVLEWQILNTTLSQIQNSILDKISK